MIPAQWSYIVDFNPGEDWGEPHLMCPLHIHHLWLIRNMVGYPFIILDGNGKEHSRTGYHYKNVATDGYFILPVGKGNTDIFNAVSWALKSLRLEEFMGVGVYRDWHGRQGQPVLGFHFDSRGSKARWGRTEEGLLIHGQWPEVA